MNFRFTEEQERFRQEVRDFLKEEPPETFPVQHEDDGLGNGGYSNEYNRRMAEKGWLALTWPKKDGGLGRPIMDAVVMMEELAYANAPWMKAAIVMLMGDKVCRFGTERLKAEVLLRLAKGDTNMCEGFSEPEAGSDLLSLRTTAIEDGDDFVINGQKTWTSFGHFTDYIFTAAKTDPTGRPSRSISIIVVPLKTPGVTVRPLVNYAGDHYHNEVFFENVRVPKYYLLGEKNRGIEQLMEVLEGYKFLTRFPTAIYCRRVLDELVGYVKETRALREPGECDLIRRKLAQMAIEVEIARLHFYKTAWMLDQGNPIKAEVAIAKVFSDDVGLRLFNTGMEILGLHAQLDGKSKWAPKLGVNLRRIYLYKPTHLIGLGTHEILRSQIAQHGLGLPR